MQINFCIENNLATDKFLENIQESLDWGDCIKIISEKELHNSISRNSSLKVRYYGSVLVLSR
jgi:hypothetical protein